MDVLIPSTIMMCVCVFCELPDYRWYFNENRLDELIQNGQVSSHELKYKDTGIIVSEDLYHQRVMTTNVVMCHVIWVKIISLYHHKR